MQLWPFIRLENRLVVTEQEDGPVTAQGLTKQQIEQDRQCTYNVTLRRVRVTIVAVEKQ